MACRVLVHPFLTKRSFNSVLSPQISNARFQGRGVQLVGIHRPKLREAVLYTEHVSFSASHQLPYSSTGITSLFACILPKVETGNSIFLHNCFTLLTGLHSATSLSHPATAL